MLNFVVYFWPIFSSSRAHPPSADPSPSNKIFDIFRLQLRLRIFIIFHTPSKPPKAAQNRPKSLQKPPQDPPKTTSKPHLILQCPKSQKNTTLPYETLIFDVPRPSKIVPKSIPKRLHNRLSLGCPLGTPKTPNLDAQTSPRWTPKISLFLQKSAKNCNYSGLWSMMLLGSLQEPPKSLPRACQEASRRHSSPPEAPKSPQEAPMQPPSDLGQQRLPPSSTILGAAVLAPWGSSIILVVV